MNSNKSKKNHMHEIAVPIGLYLAKESVKTVKDKKDKKTKKNKKSNKKKVVTRVRKVTVGGVAPTSDLSDSIHLKNALSNSVSASEYTGLEGGVWPFTSKKKTSVVTPMPKPQNNYKNSNNNTKSINSKNIPNMYPSNNNTKSINSNNYSKIPNMNHQKNTSKTSSNKTNNIHNKSIFAGSPNLIQDLPEWLPKADFHRSSSDLIAKSKSNFTFMKFVSLIIVFTISFIALILILDTFKSPLYNLIPSLEIWLFNLYEILKDIKLLIKDLF